MGKRSALTKSMGVAAALAAALGLSACSTAAFKNLLPAPSAKPQAVAKADAAPVPAARNDDGVALLAFAQQPRSSGGTADVNGLISKYASYYDVPEELVHRMVRIESGYNPRARNGPYYGLMQISHATARSMGYGGEPSGLLDADTNLRYAVKYLRGAWIVGGYNQDAALRHYQRGYYYDAKRKGLLRQAGLD